MAGVLAALLMGAAAAAGEEPCVSLYQEGYSCRQGVDFPAGDLGFTGSAEACGKLGAARKEAVVEYFGAGWKLVRRVAPGNKWHPARDHLSGTAEYDDGKGTFSHRFDSIEFDQFLFATGDMKKWLIINRTEIHKPIQARTSGPAWPAPGNIEKSSISTRPYSAVWWNHQGNVWAGNEDVWIGLVDYYDATRQGDLLYGEDSYGGPQAENVLPFHDGANVYIRQYSTSARYARDDINTPPRCGICSNPSPLNGVSRNPGWSLYSARSCDYGIVMANKDVDFPTKHNLWGKCRQRSQSFMIPCGGELGLYSQCWAEAQNDCDADDTCIVVGMNKLGGNRQVYIKYTDGCVTDETYNSTYWDLYVRTRGRTSPTGAPAPAPAPAPASEAGSTPEWLTLVAVLLAGMNCVYYGGPLVRRCVRHYTMTAAVDPETKDTTTNDCEYETNDENQHYIPPSMDTVEESHDISESPLQAN